MNLRCVSCENTTRSSVSRSKLVADSRLGCAGVIRSRCPPPNAKVSPGFRPCIGRLGGISYGRTNRRAPPPSVRVNTSTLQVPSPETQDSTVTDFSTGPAHKQFSWTKAWYPAWPLNHMDKQRPQALTILGKTLVVWLDGQGEWKCMEDKCPHRMAPLSEGRLMNGKLMCSYHGWQFNSQGKCVSIPQMAPEAQASVCQNKRSCVQTFPTLVANGLLYIWPDASPTAFIDSAASQPACIPELAKDSQRWFMFMSPLQPSTAMEQVFDPSHGPFLHHGSAGLTMEGACVFEAERIAKVDVQEGFEWHHGPYHKKDGNMKAIRTFQPPCANSTRYIKPNGSQLLAQIYNVPATPYTCRTIASMQFIPPPPDPSKKPSKPGPIAQLRAFVTKRVTDMLPAWWSHTSEGVFALQDSIIMRKQEERMQGAGHYGSAYFMPAPSDYGLVALKQWLRLADYEHLWQSLGVPTGPPPAEETDMQLGDVYEFHTRHCAVCQQGIIELQAFIDKAVRTAAGLAAVALVAAVAAAAGVQQALLPGLACAALAMLAFAATYAANAKLKLFFNKSDQWRKAGGLSLVPRVPGASQPVVPFA